MLLRALLLLAAAAPVCAQSPDDVTKYLEELRAKRPPPPDLSVQRQQALAVATKQLEGAVKPAERARLYQRISGIEQALGDSEAAILAARNAVLALPGNVATALDLARTLHYNGQDAEVAVMIGADPADGAALIRRATELEANNDLLTAAFCLDLAHKLLPEDASVTDALGQMYVKEGFAGQATMVLLQAIAQAPDVSTYHYHFALARLKLGITDEARSELKTALACHPSDDERVAIQAALIELDAHK